nr:MAG TPA: hypothetical protein [Crassvirales sp.]
MVFVGVVLTPTTPSPSLSPRGSYPRWLGNIAV